MRLPLATPRLFAGALAFSALASSPRAARASALPEGTEPITIVEGRSKTVEARAGSQIVCDDPAVAHGDIVDEKFVLVAGRQGQTLCAVRFSGQNRALYLVTVREAEKK